jgi:hypothetical protein
MAMCCGKHIDRTPRRANKVRLNSVWLQQDLMRTQFQQFPHHQRCCQAHAPGAPNDVVSSQPWILPHEALDACRARTLRAGPRATDQQGYCSKDRVVGGQGPPQPRHGRVMRPYSHGLLVAGPVRQRRTC